MNYFINKTTNVCVSCSKDDLPNVQREKNKDGLTEVDQVEYEIVKMLQFHGAEKIFQYAKKWGFMDESTGTMLTDSKNRTWHIFERTDGSITIYYTLPGESAHRVVFDTLDREKS